MSYHPGNYVGGHSGLGDSTRKIVVKELRKLADQIDARAEGPGSGDWDGGYAMGVQGAAVTLRDRADEIEDAGAVRWDCGPKVGEPHVAGCACPARLANEAAVTSAP